MLKFSAVLAAFSAGIFIPNQAHAKWGDWSSFKTDTGCIFYKQIFAISEEEYNLWNKYKWSGPCRSGSPINGFGVLTEVGNLKYTTGRPGISYNYYEGTMVDGAWDGSVTHRDDYGGDKGNYGPTQYTMGCPVRDGKIANDCTPRPRRSASSSRGASILPLRPTINQEAHDPTGEATSCVQVASNTGDCRRQAYGG